MPFIKLLTTASVQPSHKVGQPPTQANISLQRSSSPDLQLSPAHYSNCRQLIPIVVIVFNLLRGVLISTHTWPTLRRFAALLEGAVKSRAKLWPHVNASPLRRFFKPTVVNYFTPSWPEGRRFRETIIKCITRSEHNTTAGSCCRLRPESMFPRVAY